MTTLRIALALAVIGIALASCGDASPTRVATLELSAAQEQPHVLAAPEQQLPIPTVTIAPTTPANSESSAGAQPLPIPVDTETDRGCEQTTDNISYDIMSIATTPDLHWIYDIRVSGEDYHIRLTMVDQEGTVNEFIGFNGVNYVHAEGQWGALDQYSPLSTFHSLHPITGGSVVCPNLDLGAVTRVGEGMLESRKVEHFRLAEGSNIGPVANIGGALSVVDVLERTWDIWVDSNGQLVQTDLTADYAATADYPQTRVTVRSIISGVGEPNVITAPALPTPTPTPAP